MRWSLIGAFAGGVLGGVAGAFLGGGFFLAPTVKLEHTDLLAALARLAIVLGGGLGAVAGAVVGAAGDLTNALRRMKSPS